MNIWLMLLPSTSYTNPANKHAIEEEERVIKVMKLKNLHLTATNAELRELSGLTRWQYQRAVEELYRRKNKQRNRY